MKSIALLFIMILFPLCCLSLVAQENPFMQMAGKKYAEYVHEIIYENQKLFWVDSLEVHKVIAQIREVAEKTGDMKWSL